MASLTSILPLPEMLALGWFFLCWVGYAWYADHRRVAGADFHNHRLCPLWALPFPQWA
jgi:hypothetical protein